MTEREARAERAVETARRVQAVIGTARFGATIAELETQFRTKLRDFVNGAPLQQEAAATMWSVLPSEVACFLALRQLAFGQRICLQKSTLHSAQSLAMCTAMEPCAMSWSPARSWTASSTS